MCFSEKFSQLCAYNSDVRCTMSENQKVKRAEPIETCSYKSPCVRHCCLNGLCCVIRSENQNTFN